MRDMAPSAKFWCGNLTLAHEVVSLNLFLFLCPRCIIVLHSPPVLFPPPPCNLPRSMVYCFCSRVNAGKEDRGTLIQGGDIPVSPASSARAAHAADEAGGYRSFRRMPPRFASKRSPSPKPPGNRTDKGRAGSPHDMLFCARMSFSARDGSRAICVMPF